MLYLKLRQDYLLKGVVLGAVLLFCGLPVFRLAVEISTDISLGMQSSFIDTLSRNATWTAAIHSLITASCSTLLAIILGGAWSYAIALTDIRGKSLLVFCLMLPMMIPPQVTALSWVQLFGPSSVLLNTFNLAPPLGSPQPLYSESGIILLLGIQQAPLVFLSLRAYLRNLPREIVEAARCSGANPGHVWRHHILPLSTPGLIAGGGIAFVSSLGNFGIPAILGIPFSYYSLPTLIYQRLTDFGSNVLGSVATLAFLIGCIAAMAVTTQHLLLKNRDFRLNGISGQPLSFQLGCWRLPVEILLWTILVLILVLPLTALLASSLVPAFGVQLSPATISFSAYREVLFHQDATARAFTNSLSLATSCALLLLLITVPLAYFSQHRKQLWCKKLLVLVDLPFALPGVVLSIACILLFARPIPILQLSLYGTLGIILFAYLARFMAVSLKPVSASFAQLDPAMEEAAASCGASFSRRMREILLPMVSPAAGASVILVFLHACNELTVSALLWSAKHETLGILIFNLDDGGESVLAAAVSVLIICLIMLLMFLLDRKASDLPKGVIPWRD
ncbi:ABC transporter permease [Desulfogranum japonicum]|uniref:ABC transporter permease n=1 Tax=Desulfogranum japonicum TaxID=231447 RepID=UPI00040B27D1|nr:iron ABC transporter permease [Desulfogranum japonicum]